MALNIEIVDPVNLHKYREKWNELAASMSVPSVFCTWEWMYLWWKHFGHTYEPLLVMIEEEGELVGILPLALKNMTPEDGIFPVKMLTIWGSLDLHADHLDVIAAKEKQNDCVDKIFNYLKDKNIRCDLIHFSHIEEGSALFNYAKKLPKNKTDYFIASVAPYIDIKNEHNYSIDSYRKNLGTKKRNEIKRRINKLYENDDIHYKSYSNENIKSEIKKLFELHEKRAYSKDIKTSFGGKAIFDFHMALAELFSDQDTLWIRSICLNNDPLAMAYIFHYSNKLFGYQMGLDPEYEPKGIGMILLYSTIEEAFLNKIDEYDFLRGGEIYKSKWTTNVRKQYNVNIYSNTFYGYLFKNYFIVRVFLKNTFNKYIKKKSQ